MQPTNGKMRSLSRARCLTLSYRRAMIFSIRTRQPDQKNRWVELPGCCIMLYMSTVTLEGQCPIYQDGGGLYSNTSLLRGGFTFEIQQVNFYRLQLCHTFKPSQMHLPCFRNQLFEFECLRFAAAAFSPAEAGPKAERIVQEMKGTNMSLKLG